jgi:hypothetical protein
MWTVDRAIASALQIVDDSNRCLSVARLAKYTANQRALYIEAIKTLDVIPSPVTKRTTGYDLLTLLPDDFADEILVVVERSFDPTIIARPWRRPVLHRLFAQKFRLSDKAIDEAVRALKSDGSMSEIASRLMKVASIPLRTLWSIIGPVLGNHSRQGSFSELRMLLPSLSQADVGAISMIFRAVVDVARWWP